MACKRWIIAAACACALTMMVEGAQPAPFGSAATELGSASAAKSGFKRVAYRLCWTEGGARQCRWVDNARVYGYRASRVSGYVSPRAYGYRAGYPAPRVYGYRVAPAFGYVAPRAYGYSAPPVVSGDVATSPYIDSLAPFSSAVAPPAYGYSAAPVYGYAGAPPAFYSAGPPIVRRVAPAIDYAHPNLYPTGTPAWWAVMDRQDRGGRPD
jgi:hypothetical protein